VLFRSEHNLRQDPNRRDYVTDKDFGKNQKKQLEEIEKRILTYKK
jgi:hypothetical protein